MKKFFVEHSYDMVKMFLNQFAIAIFGFTLVLAAGQAQNPTLRNVTSVCAIAFYLFLLYTMTWELGFRDKVAVETGRKKYQPFTGALISLCANSINFLLGIFIVLANLLPKSVISDIGGVCGAIASLLEGMFTGLLANRVNGVPLNACWNGVLFLLIPIPAIVTCAIAYQMGIHDKAIFHIFRKKPSQAPTKKD